MSRKSITAIQKIKKFGKITCLTAYTSSIAKIVDKHVDIILVGDSLGTALYGMKNTQEVTLGMMMNHGRAVFNSSQQAFTIIDMPYQTYKNKREALINAKKLLKFTRCQSVKIETDKNNVHIVKHLKNNNINVVSHIGITPQKHKNFSKIRSVGNTVLEIQKICKLAVDLEKAGSSLIILECIKANVAKEITKLLSIPTIGIGASVNCDGQVLVINDILETNKSVRKPRFVKNYSKLNVEIENAVKKYCYEVKMKKFPTKKNSY
tara:strand:- start:1853 stop:2644 length:792 start_codon:yes stop_codon:yes gene_type:complete